MINDVLDISRIETDQLEISAEPVLVAELSADTIRLMRPIADQASAQVHGDTRKPDTKTKPLHVGAVLGLLEQHSRQHEAPDTSRARRHPKDTVLYIEDDAANIRLLERVLRLRPHLDLTTATTGREGVRIAHNGLPSLVLLDRRLPDMRGDDVLRQLKESTATAAIPIVMLSGDSAREHTEDILRLGADAFLSKPVDLDELLRTIDRFCPVSHWPGLVADSDRGPIAADASPYAPQGCSESGD
jgi:CheY-like chemotaxis protein